MRNSNLEASDIEVCQICLATDVKMFSLGGGILDVCLKTILELNDNFNMEGLPQFVCFECSAVLFKCHKLVEKSKIAQATLFDIFTENGQITEYLVKKKDREQLGIHSTLVSPESFPIFEYEYNEEDSITSKTRDYYKLKADKRKFITLKISMDKSDEDDAETKTESQFETDEIIIAGDEISKNYFIDDYVDSFDLKENSPVSESNEEDVLQNADVKYFEDQELSDDITIKDEPLVRHKQLKDEINAGMTNITKVIKSEVHGNSEINITAVMTKYYKLVRLGLQKQLNEFQRLVHETLSLETNFQCDVCQKKFETELMLSRHVFCHDPLRGPVVCPVCKFRFKDKKRANKHSILHSKRYHCKLCPKIMLSWTSAKKHLGRHLGVRYQCPDCAFTTAVQSDLPLHRRRHHATAAHCVYCGKGFIGEFGLNMHVNLVHARASQAPKPKKVFTCEECDVDFHSEGARLLHMLNSKTHKIKNQKSAYATRSSTVCKRSGNAPAIEKRKDERIKPLLKFYRKPASARDYPKQCDLCETVLETRADHYAHVRRAHPAQRGAWQPIVTVYCDTCGHGYATKAALRRHVLRHKSPTVKCSHCPRYFHDKYSMAAHAILHAEEEDKPHPCALCGKGFAHRSKLAKHMVVHSSDRPYSCSVCRKTFKCTNSLSRHMRKVHLRMHSKSAEKTKKTKKTD